MEPLTVMLARLLARYPITFPYVLVCLFVIVLVGLHPW